MEKPTCLNGLTDTRGQSWIPMRSKPQTASWPGGSSTVRPVSQILQDSIYLVIGRLPCLSVGGFQCPTESCNLQQEQKQRVSIHLLFQGWGRILVTTMPVAIDSSAPHAL